MQKENKTYLIQQEKMVCCTWGHIIWNSSHPAYFWKGCYGVGRMARYYRRNVTLLTLFNKEKCFHRKFDFHKSFISAQFLSWHLVCYHHCIWNVTLECSSLLNKPLFRQTVYFLTVTALIYLKFSHLLISVRISLAQKQSGGQWSRTMSTEVLSS